MEMFERDGQVVLNEYLAGLIDEKLFQSDCKLWNNYEDYKPIVLFAKENKAADSLVLIKGNGTHPSG